jgi:uncharacterized membrane protein YkoI
MRASRKFLLGGLTSAAVIAGSCGVAGASTPATVAKGSFVGSVPAAGLSAAQRSAAAAVTPDQADATAVATVPGTAGTPELISDYGYLVYRTIVTASDGTKTEVIIDAGDGTVLDHYAPFWNGVIGAGDNDVFGIAAASTATTAATTSAPTASFVGSIVWNGSRGAALKAMATVTAAQANAAAVAAVPGTAGTPEVIFDRGYVVYRTIVTAADGTKTEVIVDAGNATVLDQYAPVWNGLLGSTTTTTTTTALTAPFVGSITKTDKTAAEIAALVTVTPSQANDAAVAAIPGTPGTPELIHDYSFVVYRTVVTAADGTRTEVIVDPGTGAVLDHYAPVWDGIPGSDGF